MGRRRCPPFRGRAAARGSAVRSSKGVPGRCGVIGRAVSGHADGAASCLSLKAAADLSRTRPGIRTGSCRASVRAPMSATDPPLAAHDEHGQCRVWISLRSMDRGGDVAGGERSPASMPSNREAVRCGRCRLVVPCSAAPAPAHVRVAWCADEPRSSLCGPRSRQGRKTLSRARRWLIAVGNQQNGTVRWSRRPARRGGSIRAPAGSLA